MRFTTATLTTALLLAPAVAAPPSAPAATDPRILALLKAGNRGCDVASASVVPGAVRGEAGPVRVVQYAVEGCGGGNNWASLMGVVIERGGKLALVEPAPLVDGQVESVAVRDGVIVVDAMAYAPSDPRCCPSRAVHRRLVLSNGKLVRAP